MSRIFKPRRANKSSAKTPSGRLKNLILEEGEFMMLKDDTSANSNYEFYVGDGTTTLYDLPPAITGGSASESVVIVPDTSSTSAEAISHIVSGSLLGNLIGSIKQALTKINSEKANVNHTHTGYALTTHNHDDRYARLNNSTTFSNEIKLNEGASTGTYPRINFARITSTAPVKIESQTNDGVTITSPRIYFESRTNNNQYQQGNVYFSNDKVHISTVSGTSTYHTTTVATADGANIESLDSNNTAQNTNLYLYKDDGNNHTGASRVLTEANFSLSGDVLTITTSF